MLRRIFADNYRCFVNFEFQPARMNLLFGDWSIETYFLFLMYKKVISEAEKTVVWARPSLPNLVRDLDELAPEHLLATPPPTSVLW